MSQIPSYQPGQRGYNAKRIPSPCLDGKGVPSKIETNDNMTYTYLETSLAFLPSSISWRMIEETVFTAAAVAQNDTNSRCRARTTKLPVVVTYSHYPGKRNKGRKLGGG